jgi:hypothetical protein
MSGGGSIVTPPLERRPRVLCVDDDAFMREILTRSIGTEYEVLSRVRELRGPPSKL